MWEKKSRPPQREPTRAPLMCWSSCWRTRDPLPFTRDAFPSYSGHYKSLLNPSANIGMIKNEDSYDFPVFQCLNFQILPCQRCLLHGLRACHVWSQHGGAQSLGDRAGRRAPEKTWNLHLTCISSGNKLFIGCATQLVSRYFSESAVLKSAIGLPWSKKYMVGNWRGAFSWDNWETVQM